MERRTEKILEYIIMWNPEGFNHPGPADYLFEAGSISDRIRDGSGKEILDAYLELFPEMDDPDIIASEGLEYMASELSLDLQEIEKEERRGKMTKEELTKIREDLNLKKKELADMLGISPMMMGRYEKGICAIPDAVAQKAAELVSAGKEETAEETEEDAPADAAALAGDGAAVPSLDETDMPAFVKAIRSALNLSRPAFAKLIKVSTASVGFYETGWNKPREEVLARIKALAANKTEPAAEPAAEPMTEEKAAEEVSIEEVMPEPVVEETTPEPVIEKAPAQDKEVRKPRKRTRKTSSKKEKASGTSVFIQSMMGGTITQEEVLSRLPDGVETVYIKPEENKAYWVKGSDSGSIDLW